MKKDHKNDKLLLDNFSESVKINVKDPEALSGFEKLDLWQRILIVNANNMGRRTGRYRMLFSLCSGVAVVLLVVLISILKIHDVRPVQEVVSVNIEDVRKPDIEASDIQLVLNSDKTVSLPDNDVEITYDKHAITLTDKADVIKKEELDTEEPEAFNQLIVPLGKRSVLNFADGSRIWVNAGTRVVYPPVFGLDKREIYVDGEIFADVAHDETRPFIVKTKNVSLQVMGTSFNVNAYESDDDHRIVLVSGSVKVNMNYGETILAPNQMFSCDGNAFQVRDVNVTEYVSWKEGIYQYESESLGVILKRLSRYYGQEIVCSPEVARLKCSGKLELKGDLDRVLKGVARTASVRCTFENGRYRITNNTR